LNVIFLDLDGVINTVHLNSNEDEEKKIKLLSEICKEYNAKIVIEASIKDFIDENTLEYEGEYLERLFNLFNKYGIEVIGRTPNVEKDLGDNVYISMWKEDEIIGYLSLHPEIDHFCVIDDDDGAKYKEGSDLNKLRDYLIKTLDSSTNKDEEGLLESHKEEVGKILKKENRYKKKSY
jgi:hypothetical protein